MPGWSEYILAFAVFFLSHALPVRPAVKARLVNRVGPAGFSLAYSVLSIIVLGWLISAAGRAPYVELWPRAPWQTWVPLVLMAFAAIILALAIARPNPLSFGGARNARFDPTDAGIVGWMRHPLLAAIAIWAAAHIVPNGDLAHALLFAVFLGFALLGMRLIDRRKRRQLGDDWVRLAATSRGLTVTGEGTIRLALGLGIYALLLWLHRPVIGVYPWP